MILIKFGRLLQPLVVECIGYYADKLPTHAVSHKISQVHHRRVVFGREPPATFSHLVAADVAGISPPYLPACPVILPKAIFEKTLYDDDLGEPAVGTHGESGHRIEQTPGL